MAAKDPSIRRQVATIGGLTYAATHDMKALAARGKQGRWERYLREVDPDGLLDPKERERRAKAAERAAMRSLALKSAQARRKGAS